MRRPILCGILLSLALSGYGDEPDPRPSFYTANGGKAWSEKVNGKVVKVFSAEYVGGRFVAYQVKWRDTDVVVHEGALDKTKVLQEGDDITFLVQTVEHPMAGKPVRTLSFMTMPPFEAPQK
jgi:hypothetical protein